MTAEKTKRPYATPTLQRYGRVEAITSGQTGPASDGKSGMAMVKMFVRAGGHGPTRG